MRSGATAGSAGALTAPRGQVLILALPRGSCTFVAHDRRPRSLRPGQVLLADGGETLEIRPEGDARLAGVSIPGHLLVPRFLSAERLRAASLRNHGLGMAPLLCELLLKVTNRGDAACSAEALVDALGGMLSATLEHCQAVEPPARGDVGRARLEQIERHLRRHFADPNISAIEVAAAVGVSRRYLHKLFERHGRSFRDELIGLRIEACAQAFQNEAHIHKSIADIAFAAGYTDMSQFNRHFRSQHGVPPTVFRRAAFAKLAAAE